jgi:methylphosphotriester-DNA--protein-cysteine methyltransferase
MIEKICIGILSLVIILLILRIRKEKNPNFEELELFYEKAGRLIAQFNQTAEKNINLLEEKITEAKEILKEAEEKPSLRISGSVRYPEVFQLAETGLTPREIAKKVRMSQHEVELILKGSFKP